MNTVKINKEKLLNQLQKNRNEHMAIYKDAIDGWKTDVRLALVDALDKARKDIEYITDIDIDEPVSHEDDYKNIIARVEWHEAKFIDLDQREFNQFILDKWDWQHHFLTSSSSYSSSSSSSSSSLITKKMSQL